MSSSIFPMTQDRKTSRPATLYLVAVEKPVRGEEDVPVLERRRFPFFQLPPVFTPEDAEDLKRDAIENYSFYASDQQPMIVTVRKYRLDGEISFICQRPG